MGLSRRSMGGVILVLVAAVAIGIAVWATRPSPAATTVSTTPVSVAEQPPDPTPIATPSGPAATPLWGGPLPNGAPGPGASPCIEVNPGDCGIVTPYRAGFEPVPRSPLPRY
jgi:hypothetical protein